jgi:hypothetical protein
MFAVTAKTAVKLTENVTELKLRFNSRQMKKPYLLELCENTNCFDSKHNMPK